MPNRVYWAVTAFALDDTLTNVDIANAEFVTGVQSVGITTTFNLEQVFQLGQLSLFQDVEEVPDIEISVERVLDGTYLLYNRCMGGTNKTISALQNNQVNAYFQIAADSIDNVGDIDSDSENLAWVYCSGMYLSSWSLACPTDGNFTESVTLVGNHKQWKTMAANTNVADKIGGGHALPTAAEPDSDDNVTVRRRQHFTWADIPKPLAAGSKITNVTTSVDFGREMINVLGTKLPYYRYVTYPVEVTCEIEALFHIGISNTYATTTDWPLSGAPDNDIVQATNILGDGIQAFPNARNVESQTIKFYVSDKGGKSTSGTKVDLGTANKCTSVAYGGGTTGGENATVTYSFRNFNDLIVDSSTGVDPEATEPSSA